MNTESHSTESNTSDLRKRISEGRSLRFPGEKPPKVLVVDDNLTYRLVLCALLEQMGATTSQAVSGDDAIGRAGQEQFDVILMDVGLPDMDGYLAASRIQTASAKHVPIIACTAYDGLEERELAAKAGMYTFITKPAGRKSVFLAILECLSERKAAKKRSGGSEKISKDVCAQESVLDTESLSDMLAGLSPETRLQVLSSVPVDTNASLAIMNTAALNSDLCKLEIAAHRLKGLARTFGARQLAMLTDKLHNLAREGQGKDALACVPAVQAGARDMLDALAEQANA